MVVVHLLRAHGSYCRLGVISLNSSFVSTLPIESQDHARLICFVVLVGSPFNFFFFLVPRNEKFEKLAKPQVQWCLPHPII